MINFQKNLLAYLCFLGLAFVLLGFFPPLVSAQTEYIPLAPIPDTLNSTGSTNLGIYLTGMFKVGIAVAGALAFLMIVWGGFTYLSTDAITGKEEGKEHIKNAVGGLILAMVAYLILNTINAKLVDLDIRFGTPARVAPQLGAPVDLIFYGPMTDNEKEALRQSIRGNISSDVNDRYQDLFKKKNDGTATQAELQTLNDLEVVRQGTVAINKISLAEVSAYDALKKVGYIGTIADNGQAILNQMQRDAYFQMRAMQQGGATPEQIAVVQSRYNRTKEKIEKCIAYVRSGSRAEPPTPECKK